MRRLRGGREVLRATHLRMGEVKTYEVELESKKYQRVEVQLLEKY